MQPPNMLYHVYNVEDNNNGWDNPYCLFIWFLLITNTYNLIHFKMINVYFYHWYHSFRKTNMYTWLINCKKYISFHLTLLIFSKNEPQFHSYSNHLFFNLLDKFGMFCFMSSTFSPPPPYLRRAPQIENKNTFTQQHQNK